MRIAYFGGTFDPPHRGHVAIARAAADRFHLDRVLLAPAAKQPLKPKGSMASFADRLAMVSTLSALDSRLEASEVDAPRADGSPNYTVNTLARLRAELQASDQLFVLTGADAFAGIEQWHQHERLFDLAEWIVVSRPGQDVRVAVEEVVMREPHARVHPLTGIHEDVSATEVRARLQAGDSCEELLPEPVREYIQAHGLYRAPVAAIR